MAISVGTAGSRITANAAAVATAMAGGTSTAEAQALGAFLTAIAAQEGQLLSALRLINNTNLTENRPS